MSPLLSILSSFLISSSITSSEPYHPASFETQSTLKEPQFSQTLKASVYVRGKDESEDSAHDTRSAEKNTENGSFHPNENEKWQSHGRVLSFEGSCVWVEILLFSTRTCFFSLIACDNLLAIWLDFDFLQSQLILDEIVVYQWKRKN